MSLLPEEFGGTEERPGAHFPPYHVAPLIAEDGQVPPGLDPVLIDAPDDGFGGRTHDELFFQLGIGIHHHALPVGVVHKAVVRHHGALLGESGHVLCFFAEEGFRNEEGEICVLYSGFLKGFVQDGLHLFPDGIAVRLDHHAAADGGLFGQICLDYYVVIPLGIIL